MLFNAILVGLAALASTVAAMPAPVGTTRLNTRDVGMPEILHNASSLLGWELVALANSSADYMNQLCDLSAQRGSHWAAVGLNLGEIQEPICSAARSGDFPTHDVLARTLYGYNTDLFITQILNTFDVDLLTVTPEGNMNPYQFLCRYGLSYEQLKSFHLQSGLVMDQVCYKAGMELRVEQEHEPVTVNETIAHEFCDSVTVLLGAEIAATAESTDELSAWCNNATSYTDGMLSVGLNPGLFKGAICYNQQLVTPGQLMLDMGATTTNAYTIELGHIGNGIADWNQWLCATLDVNGMNSVALDGQKIKDTFCQASQGTFLDHLKGALGGLTGLIPFGHHG